MQLDVTARKRVEQKLLEEQRRKDFQLTLGDELRRLDRPEAIEQTVCDALGRHFRLAQVGLLQAAAQQEDAVWIVAGWPAADSPMLQTRTVRTALRDAILRESSLSLSGTPDLPAGGLVVPMGRWGRHAQGLALFPAQPFEWQPEDQACVEEVAERLCDAAERAAHPLQLQERVEQTIAERDRIWRLSPEVLAIMDGDGRFISVSPAVHTILGWTSEQFLARGFLTLLHPDDRRMTRLFLAQAAQGGKDHPRHLENRLRRRDGSYGYMTWTVSAAQGMLYMAGRDDTQTKAQSEALKEAELALRQAQKMEAVGLLTGGIAHDFNNILQGISSALYLMDRHLARGNVEAAPRYVRMAAESCDRASRLTQRLLAFSRREPVNPQRCDVGQTLLSMQELFRRYTGESVVLALDIEPAAWGICCDLSQFENVVLNLIINACDAMPDGGRVVLQVRNARLDEVRLRGFAQPVSGDFLEIAVTDTGCGMAPEVLARTFEPFFTTKPAGAGTGLGLSTCYRFAQQAGGAADIESQAGQGTTVRLWLPRHAGEFCGEPAAKPVAVGDEPPISSGAVVVLVEDNDSVREMMTEAIAAMGVSVRCASDGVTGVRLVEQAGRVDLLVSDVGLPGMDGRDLAAQARNIRPDLPVLFLTGHVEAASEKYAVAGTKTGLIIKPFTLDVLVARVREMLSYSLT
jgi:PAS domain S-box-containing protein